MIPKVFHYVWLGPEPMPQIMNRWRERWAALNPGVWVRVWAPVPGLPEHFLGSGDELVECRNPEYLAKCPTPAKKSDVWRFEILEQKGGIYLDADMEPLRPFEGFHHAAFAGLCNTIYDWSEDLTTYKMKLEVGCSIMGAEAHHPWIRDMVLRTPSRDPVEKLSLAFPFVTFVTGRHPDVELYEPDVFYPVRWDAYALRKQHLTMDESFSGSTIAVHRWSSCWFKPEEGEATKKE